MMETFTPTLNSIVYSDENLQKTVDMLSIDELEFYENLKPSLNQLITNPTDDIVNRILDFSKTLQQ